MTVCDLLQQFDSTAGGHFFHCLFSVVSPKIENGVIFLPNRIRLSGRNLSACLHRLRFLPVPPALFLDIVVIKQ